MSQAARAHDPWADDLHTPPRRRPRVVDSWASAEDLEVLGGLGRDPSATWTVLTLDRDDEVPGGYADATGDLDWPAEVGPAGWSADPAPTRWSADPGLIRSRFVRTAVDDDLKPPVRLVDPESAPIDHVAEPPAPLLPGQRRTVVIRGRVPAAVVVRPDRRHRAAGAHHRVGHRPDRVALWAFILGLVLILIAVLSAGGSA